MKFSKLFHIFIVLFSLAAMLDDHDIIIYCDLLLLTSEDFGRSNIIIGIYDLVTNHDYHGQLDYQMMTTLLTGLFLAIDEITLLSTTSEIYNIIRILQMAVGVFMPKFELIT